MAYPAAPLCTVVDLTDSGYEAVTEVNQGPANTSSGSASPTSGTASLS
jgi:hypothetical protein